MTEINDDSSSINQILRTLDPGALVNEVFVNGVSEPAKYFVALDSDSNLAYFVQEDGDILVADSRRIDMIELNT